MSAQAPAKRRLGDVCLVRKGTIITEKQSSPGQVPVVAGGTKPAYFHNASNRGPGAVTISASGYAGYVSYWQVPIWASDCITVEPMEPGTADPSYLFHQLKYLEPTVLTSLQRGAAQKHVYAKDIQEIELPLPTIEEQRRIASILDAADALRTKRRQALEKLESLTQSIFIDMFGDPVVNSREWPLADLQDLGTLDRGVSKHRPRNDPSLLGGAWPLIQTGEVAGSGGYIDRFESTYSDLGLAQSRLWPAGTLCITIAANIAKTGILQFEACFPDSVVGFTATDRGTIEYVRSVLNFLQPALEKQAPESAQKNINLKVLRELKVPVPPNDLRAKFAERVDAVNDEVKAMTTQIRLVDRLFASLQHSAFRGEL